MTDETPTPPATPSVPDAPRGASAPNNATPDQLAALQAQLDALKKENEAAKAAQAELATLKKAQEDAEQARLAEQGQFKELAERRQGELKIKDQRILRAEVRAAAVAEGLVDKDVAQLIPLDDSMMVNGEPDLPKIEAAVKAYKAQKPALFKAVAPTQTGSAETPPPAPTQDGKFSFSQLNPVDKASRATAEASKRDADKLFNQAVAGLRR